MNHRFAAIGAALLLAVAATSGRAGGADPPREPAIRRRRGHGGPRLPAARPAAAGPAGLQRPRLPRLVPGPGGLPPVAVRLRLQGRPRGPARRRSPAASTSRRPRGARSSRSRRWPIPHKGGKRLEDGSWQYRMLVPLDRGRRQGRRPTRSRFERLEVTPAEIVFERDGRDGPAARSSPTGPTAPREDVTCSAASAPTTSRSPRSTPTAW